MVSADDVMVCETGFYEPKGLSNLRIGLQIYDTATFCCGHMNSDCLATVFRPTYRYMTHS